MPSARGRGSVQTGALGADPQVGGPVGQLDGAVQQLHWCVGQVGEHELRFQLPGRCGQRRHVGVEVARAGATGQLAVLSQLPFAVHFLHGRRVPLQLQRVAPLLGRPVAVGHHGHAFATAVQRHAQHALHALDGARGAIVHRGQSRAEYGRMRHHGGELAGQARVDAEVLSPAALRTRIEARGRAADDPEILGVLQRDLPRPPFGANHHALLRCRGLEADRGGEPCVRVGSAVTRAGGAAPSRRPLCFSGARRPDRAQLRHFSLRTDRQALLKSFERR
jgi:hypothetical protein